MSVGRDFKNGFNEILRLMGCTVLIHKQWGTPHQKTTEVRGLKNNAKNRPDKVMFQFPERLDIEIGDILQQKGARDLWRVIDVEDEIHDDVYINFEAKVQKFSGPASSASSGRSPVIVQGSVYGGIQVDSPHATQNISVHILQVDENVRHLRDLLQKSAIPELEKEEAALALERVSQLSRKERSPQVLGKIKEKLDFVKTTFDLVKDVAPVAAPYISAIAQAIFQ